MSKRLVVALTLVVLVSLLVFPAAPTSASQKPADRQQSLSDVRKDKCMTWHGVGFCWTLQVQGTSIKVGVSLKYKSWRTPTLWAVNANTCLSKDWQVASGKVCIKDIKVKIKNASHGSVAFKIGGQACVGAWIAKKCWNTPWWAVSQSW